MRSIAPESAYLGDEFYQVRKYPPDPKTTQPAFPFHGPK